MNSEITNNEEKNEWPKLNEDCLWPEIEVHNVNIGTKCNCIGCNNVSEYLIVRNSDVRLYNMNVCQDHLIDIGSEVQRRNKIKSNNFGLIPIVD